MNPGEKGAKSKTRDVQNSEIIGSVFNGCDKAVKEPHFLSVWVANYIQVSLCF